MSWLIYDYETLSDKPRICPVVCYAGMVVDPDRFSSDNPYTLTEIREKAHFAKFDTMEQIDKWGKVVQARCLDWWKTDVDKETRTRLLTPSDEDRPFSDIPVAITETLGNCSLDKVITRGNTFDPIILEVACEQLEVEMPYAWWIVRESRSFLDGLLWGSGIDQKFTPATDAEFHLHDPIDDIALDILRLQTVIRGMQND